MTPAGQAREPAGLQAQAQAGRSPVDGSPSSAWPIGLGLAMAYFLAAAVSLYISRSPTAMASIWYANAVAVAVLYQQPVARWPVLLLALVVANPLANWLWGDGLWQALSFVPANVAEVVLAAWLLKRFGPGPGRGLTPGGLVRLLLLGGVLPQLVGASLGTLTVSLPGDAGVASVWLPWFSGSVIGAMSVLPLAALLAGAKTTAWSGMLLDSRLWALLPLTIGSTLLSLAAMPFPFAYTILPLLLAAGIVALPAVALLTAVSSITVAYAMGTGIMPPPPLSAAWEMVFVHIAFAATLLPAQILSAAITELRRGRERLAESTAALKRSNDSLEQFVRIAAHDLREPLNTVSAFGGLLEQRAKGGMDEKSQQYLRYVLQGTDRMRTVLDDVLCFVQVQQSGAPQFEVVSLEDALGEARLALTQRVESTGARLEGDVQGWVRAQPVLLSLVFQNLIQNAIKFVPEGRQPLIRISAERVGPDWRVQVADNGIGIEPDDLHRLFQPFQRLHPRRMYEGTGLGLALVQQILQAHGGRVEVTSTVGEGSCFALYLPAA